MKKLVIISILALLITLIVTPAYYYLKNRAREQVHEEAREEILKEHKIEQPIVDEGYYFNSISIKGDTVALSVVSYHGIVGSEDDKISHKWLCTDPKVKKMIANATIDFHQQPGQLKMMAQGKGLMNEKYINNESFLRSITVENNKIVKFK